VAEKINIMYIIDCLSGIGGTENHLSYLTTMLDKEKFNFIVVIFDLGENQIVEKMREEGVPMVHIPVGRYYTYNAIKQAFRLSKIIKQNEIDIVQTFHFKSDFYGALVAHFSGVRHIISSRRDIGGIKKKWHIFLTRKIDRFVEGYIVPCNAIGKVIVKKEKILSSKIQNIYNGTNIEAFSPSDTMAVVQTRRQLGLSESDFIIGTVAQFRPEKGYDIFFKAIEKTKARIKELKVIVIGGGPLFDYYSNYVKDKGLAGQVILTGQTGKVEQYLKILDIACLVPTKNEGFSNSILEKMATGLPLIVSDVGGNAEAVLDGYNGKVISPNNVDELVDAVVELYNNAHKMKDMGKKSRQRVEKLFTLKNMIENHEKYYEKILK